MFQFRHLFEQFQDLSTHRKIILSLDFLMLFLVSIDLIWMVFDLLLVQLAESALDSLLFEIPSLYAKHLNPWFLTLDTLVIFAFVSEFFLRWAYAIWFKTYGKWFFYPLAHWYDILGSIPSSSFRFVRLFRIIGMAYRLQRWRIIDLKNYSLFRVLHHYYEVLMEEISDRVAGSILNQVKQEFQREPPLSEQIIDEVLYPKKDMLVLWISRNIQSGLRESYARERKSWREYLRKTVEQSMNNSPEVANLRKIPMLGTYMTELLNQAVAGVVFGVVDQITRDAADAQQHGIVYDLTDELLETLLQDEERLLQNLSNQIVSEVIDRVIERVEEKNWQRGPDISKL